MTGRLIPRVVSAALLCVSISSVNALAQTSVPFVALGDSVGEGVQSADASYQTQGYSFPNLIAWRMGLTFPLPLIVSGPLASVASLDGRTRYDAAVKGWNLAASGATVGSLLRERAAAVSAANIHTETELVLFPRQGSQIEVAEALHPQVVACWIGGDDALSAVLASTHLDASQMTPVASFQADFNELAIRLDATGAKVVFATIPDLTHLAYLFDRTDLIRFFGSDLGLPAGSLTTLPTVLGLKLGTLTTSVLADPNYVLDGTEISAISNRIAAFNSIIRNVAAAHGMAVAEIAGFYDGISQSPMVIAGVPLTTRFLGGLFSLDGVHPSNFGQVLSAYLFIDALNTRYGLNIPQIDGASLIYFFLTDPFIDRDQDGRVTGRFGAGVLETLSPFLGWSGDTNDALP